jgi:hypothetical protein
VNNPGLNWGATSAERAAPLPCDALLTTATHADRAISIEAPPELVFAWLCQLRRAPYSYDIIDNRGRRSPRTLDPAMTHLEPGQRFMTIFVLQSFTDCADITLRGNGVAVTYAVRPAPAGEPAGTRLHVRVRFSGSRVIAAALACADLVMMRKQLLTLAELAERDGARAHPGPAAAPT